MSIKCWKTEDNKYLVESEQECEVYDTESQKHASKCYYVLNLDGTHHLTFKPSVNVAQEDEVLSLYGVEENQLLWKTRTTSDFGKPRYREHVVLNNIVKVEHPEKIQVVKEFIELLK